MFLCLNNKAYFFKLQKRVYFFVQIRIMITRICATIDCLLDMIYHTIIY